MITAMHPIATLTTSTKLRKQDDTFERVMLIGAGAAGQMVLHDYMTDKDMRERIVCVIDDNPNKWNRFVENVPIVGGREDILLNVEKYHIDKIIFAIPTATASPCARLYPLRLSTAWPKV